MHLPELLQSRRQAIISLCRARGVRRLDVFGSAIREDFDAESSDLDLIVDFEPAATGGLLAQYFDFKSELETLLQRPVDLVEFQALPDSRLKRLIATRKVLIYEATP
ncbi:MAG: nucleotidyltransferase domain-containing protein [Xanthomonadales bacterium]|nr:nucleotidyltransferase domain-containing protein [Xanthomonadales bacterium]